MGKLYRLAGKLIRLLNLGSCFLLLGMMAYIVIFIIIRGAFHYTLYGTYEIVQYTCLFVVCLALAGNDYIEGNVKVTVITDLIPKKWRVIPESFSLLLTCAMSIAMTYFMYDFFLMKLASNALSLNFLIPIWIFIFVLFISFILLSFSVVIRTLKYFTKYTPEEVIERDSVTEI